MDVIIGCAIGLISARFKIGHRNSNIGWRVPPSRDRQLVNYGLNATTGIKNVVNNQQRMLSANLSNQIVQAINLNLRTLIIDPLIARGPNRNMVCCHPKTR